MTSAIQNSAFRVHHSRRTPLTPHYTIPYNAKAKIIEPWHHHWVHERFDKKFTDGYWHIREGVTGYWPAEVHDVEVEAQAMTDLPSPS